MGVSRVTVNRCTSVRYFQHILNVFGPQIYSFHLTLIQRSIGQIIFYYKKDWHVVQAFVDFDNTEKL